MSIIVTLDVVMARQRTSSKALAEVLGMTPANLTKLELGETQGIRFSTLDRICSHLSCQPGDLLKYDLAGRQELAPLLSARQRECLSWVRHGKSSSEIAQIISVATQTVDEHVAEACRKLGVHSRVQAAVEATVAGFID